MFNSLQIKLNFEKVSPVNDLNNKGFLIIYDMTSKSISINILLDGAILVLIPIDLMINVFLFIKICFYFHCMAIFNQGPRIFKGKNGYVFSPKWPISFHIYTHKLFHWF